MNDQETEDAITSLRQAIAKAEKQEPFGYFRYDLRLDAWVQNRESDQGTPFYTHPQPKREWVGLTTEEILETYRGPDGSDYVEYAKALEAKLKEKNT